MPDQMDLAMVRIATIQACIEAPGLPIPMVLQAEPFQPSDMSSVSCPFFINEIYGGPTDIPVRSGMQYDTSTVNMMLCVARKEADIDLKYGVQETIAWKKAVIAAFSQHVRLSSPSMLIVGSTNTNPSVVTAAVRHGYVTGDQVGISGHLINTAINGSWNITVIDDWSYSVPVAANGAGGQTGQMRLLQPEDLASITDAVIVSWDLVPYRYGSTEFIALKFPLRIRQMYNVTISA